MFKKLLGVITPQNPQERDAQIYRNIMRDAAKIGGKVFGPVPAGTRREFFCLDEHTWIWHEEWTDAQGKYQVRTTRYDVRPHGIFKAQDGHPYRPISEEEARRLQRAVHEFDKLTGQKFDPLLAAAGV